MNDSKFVQTSENVEKDEEKLLSQLRSLKDRKHKKH